MVNQEVIQTPPGGATTATTAADAIGQQHCDPFSSSSPSSSSASSDASSWSPSSNAASSAHKRFESATSPTPPPPEPPAKKLTSDSSVYPISLSPAPESLLCGAQTFSPDWLHSAQAGRVQWRAQGSIICQARAEWLEDEESLGEKLRAGFLPHVHRLPGDCCVNFSLRFFAQGTWNRVYILSHCDCHSIAKGTAKEYIVRVALPVFPRLKMEAEVATIEFVRRQTRIPAPEVFIYSSDASNPVGYEWVVMEKMAGEPFYDVVDDWSMSRKEQLARTLADWIDSLSRLTFPEIGNLYGARTGGRIGGRGGVARGGDEEAIEYDTDFRIGPAVTQDSRSTRSTGGSSLCEDILGFEMGFKEDPGGLLCEAARRRLAEQRDAIPIDDDSLVSFDSSRYCYCRGLQAQSELCSRLLRIIEAIIPDSCDGDEDYDNKNVLYHWDISGANVLVDRATGEATGLLDWEQLHTVPLLVPNFFLTIMAPDHMLPDMSHLSVYDDNKGEEKDEQRLDSEDQWDAQCMRAAFTARLEMLDSPWLAARGNEQRQQLTVDADEEDGSAAATAINPQDRLRHLRSKLLRSLMQTQFRRLDVNELEQEASDAGFF